MKKNILLIVLGIIIGTSIGVYAIGANEVIYNNTTVDQALNTLYTDYENKYGSLAVKVYSQSPNSTITSNGGMHLTNIKTGYKYVKLIETSNGSGTGTCTVSLWNANSSSAVNMVVNQDYDIQSLDPNYSSLMVRAKSSNSSSYLCNADVVFHN